MMLVHYGPRSRSRAAQPFSESASEESKSPGTADPAGQIASSSAPEACRVVPQSAREPATTALAVADGEISAFVPGGPKAPAVLSFPPFRLDFAEERLWKGERELRLRRKPFTILRYLAQNPRRLVTYTELVDAVWGRIAMSESLVRTHMHDLRRALGEDVIETVLGRGYRFVARFSAEQGDVFTLPSSRRAYVLNGVGDVLDALGMTTTVVLIVGEADASPRPSSLEARSYPERHHDTTSE